MPELAHVIELDPTKAQKVLFAKASGCARVAFNWGLARWQELYEAGQKPSWPQLQKEFVSIVDERFPWMREVPSTAYYQPFRHLGSAFGRFFKKLGRYPRFKSKHRETPSFKLSGVKFQNGKAILPKIGEVKIKEQPRFTARVVSATVKADADRWVLVVLFEVQGRQYKLHQTGQKTVGIDLGLSSFATFSDETKVEAPNPLRKNLKCLQRRQRVLSRRQKGSNRRKRAKLSVARLHRRIRNVRKDFLQTLTTRIVRENQAIAIEDLNVKGMMQNDTLSRAIADVGWHEFKRQLTYKCILHGRTLYMAGRFFPSSKKCSECGLKKVDLTLSDRTFACPYCKHTEDRDVNAAKNLRTLALRGTYARGELQALVLDGIAQHQPTRRNVNPGVRKRAKKDQAIMSPIPGV